MIRAFKDCDIEKMSEMCFDSFGSEIENYPKKISLLIYKMMVLFYKRNENLSFVFEENNEIVAFLLGFWQNENFCYENWLKNTVNSLSEQEKTLFLNYFYYLENNEKKLSQFSSIKDANKSSKTAQVGLFISKGNGRGSILLKHFENCVKFLNAKKILLWADSFCAFNYYPKKGYSQISQLTVPSFLPNEKETMHILEKKL